MPELPDITAYITAIESRILNQRLEHIRIATPFLLRTAQPPVSAAEGQTVRELRRVGKRIAIGLENDLWLVLHLMIAGRLHWRPLGAKLGGRNNLAAFDFPHGSLTLTEAGSKRRASLHVVQGLEALQAMDPGGIDIFQSDLAAFRHALTQENRTLKRALTDPRIVSGIGNSYSDEILHAARLSPITLTQKLTLADAALVLIVIDASQLGVLSELHEEDRALMQAVEGRPALIALNKCDLLDESAEGMDESLFSEFGVPMLSTSTVTGS